MGNNASHSGNITTQQRQQLQLEQQQEQHWAHSFPRTPQRLNQQHNKVLPDVTGDVHQKLRHTNNGEILYNGGTISGRHHSSSLSLPREDIQNGVYRSSSISSRHPQEYNQKQDSPNKQRHYIPRSPPRGRSRNIPSELRHPHGGYHSQQKEMQMKRFGSVPDLRGRDRDRDSTPEHITRESREYANRARKKYKAPPPPQNGNAMVSNGSSLDSWENTDTTTDTPARKTRLFKTRAEMKKRAPSPQQNSRKTYENNNHSDESKRYRSRSREPQKKLDTKQQQATDARNERNNHNRPPPHNNNNNNNTNFKPVMLADMQRSKSLPEFQAELREATQRLRTTKFNNTSSNSHQVRQQEEKKLPPIKMEHTPKRNVQRYSLQDTKENKLKTLDPNVVKKEHIKYKMKQIEVKVKETIKPEEKPKLVSNKRSTSMDAIRGRASGKESTTPEHSPIQKARLPEKAKTQEREQPQKTFYFGMDETAAPQQQQQPNSFNSNVVDHFALSLQKHNCIVPAQQAYSGSDLSSEIDIDDSQVSTNGIALHLRPILPKKQLEIPRFSPAAAWRLLSAFDSNPPPSTVSDEGPVLIEDRIEKLARQPPPLSIPAVGPRSSHDKSGDSGISGDAGPPVFEDTSDPPPLPNTRNNNIQMSAPLNLSWTPQQDLEGEESSSEGGHNTSSSNRMYIRSTTNVKFSPRSQVFSLSLPRDNHLAAYMEEKARQHSPPNYTNLQRLKRSVSGVLGNISGKTKEAIPAMTQDQNDNWFLSRSAPNSLNNGFNSLEIRLSKHNSILQETSEEQQRPSLVPFNVKNSSNSSGGRVMYLPECKENEKYDSFNNNKEIDDDDDDDDDGGEHVRHFISHKKKDDYKYAQNGIETSSNDSNMNKTSNYRYTSKSMSKSCENISSAVVSKSPFEPEDLQDPQPIEEEIKWKGRKPKRFTFQSTVRQIERRRLAEKLSREAERKEQQRLSELEAMRRVEEEFQRKRAKEKASIRQQLRLFSLDDTSLPSNWDNKEVPARSEPDGAVSSSASSPTHDSSTNKLNNDHNFEMKATENMKKYTSAQKGSTDSKSSPTFKKIVSRQGSESSDDTRIKAQATQVLSEYRQPRREYKDYRASARCLVDGTEAPYHDAKQTTIHPQVIYNMPKAHGQGSNTDTPTRSSNYRRDFAHGIMLPGKSTDDETQTMLTATTTTTTAPPTTKKNSPRITQNQRTRQGKCIS